jgi:hypothetical protein
MIPRGQYDNSKCVNSLLVEIEFVDGKGLMDKLTWENIVRTVGGKTHSHKHFMNTVFHINT